MTDVCSKAERIYKKYKTREPYELLDAIGAVVKFSDEYEREGLKGYSAILNKVMFAVINAKLHRNDRRIVAGHEAAHLIIHRGEILSSPAKSMRDFDIYNGAGRYEREANTFLADFLVSDEETLDVITYGDKNHFHAAAELSLPPPLLAFKLHNMVRRGHKVNIPMELNSSFLKKDAKEWY